MKLIYHYLSVSLMMAAAVVCMPSCSDEYKYDTDYSFYDGAKLKVDLVDDNNVLNLKMENGTHQVTVSVEPSDKEIDLAAYIYSIADENIATITQEGVITMKNPGTTEMTIKFRGNQQLATTCKIAIDPIYVSDIRTPELISVEERKTTDAASVISILPSNASYPKLKYEVADESVATVDENGIVTGVKEAETVLIVSTTDGSGIRKEIPLKVVGEVVVSSIDLGTAANLNGKTIGVGQSFNLGAIVKALPANASNPALTYRIASGNGAASVTEDGILTTLAAGDVTVEIIAADHNTVKETLHIKVDASVTAFERSLWTVDTSVTYKNGDNFVKDGSTGRPQDILDGKTNTFLSLVKPGKSYNGCSGGNINTPVYFIVDMKSAQEFNYFTWNHRWGNANNFLRVWGVSLFGSNDGSNFTEIQSDIDIPYTDYKPTLTFDIPVSKYRYVKVQLVKWSDISGGAKSGGTMQIAEFNVGRK